jgi:hypothetical protein
MARDRSRLRSLAVSAVVLTLAFTAVDQRPALAFKRRPGPAREVSYPLRHDFSMAVGLPGHGEHEPTSCYDVHNEQKEYVCRIVAGVEETGDRRTFFLTEDEVLTKGSEPTFGTALVDRDGIQYEGCAWLDQYYGCDYATRRQVSRDHYQSKGYVLNVLWNWARYTGDQASCALALSGLWSGIGGKGFLLLLNDCKNGPM